jgi:hypothetical protein
MEAINKFETLFNFYETTQRHISQESLLFFKLVV